MAHLPPPAAKPADDDVDLGCESVAGEEDPGAALDLPWELPSAAPDSAAAPPNKAAEKAADKAP